MRGDHLIHVRTGPLFEALRADLYGPDPDPEAGGRFTTLARRVEDLVEHECATLEEELKDLYAPFSPEDLGAGDAPLEGEARRQALRRFVERLAAIFTRSNFVSVPRAELEGTGAKAQTTKGLRVIIDLDAYDEFHIYYRGDAETRRPANGAGAILARLARRPARLETVPVYRMVALVTKLKDEPHLRIKLFKDVPKEDIQCLLPNTRVAMRLVDKSRIGLSSGGALFSSVKFAVSGAAKLGAAWMGPVGFVAFLLYLGKTTLQFFRLRERYQANLIRELFYQKLDSNLGAINRLVDATEEEEAKETVLAYAFLERAREPLDLATLDRTVERYIADRFKVEADFEVDDGARKVIALGLARETADGRLEAAPLGRALETLRRRWIEIGDGAPAGPPGASPGQMLARPGPGAV